MIPFVVLLLDGEGEPGVGEGGSLVVVVHVDHLIVLKDLSLPAKRQLVGDLLFASCSRVCPLGGRFCMVGVEDLPLQGGPLLPPRRQLVLRI